MPFLELKDVCKGYGPARAEVLRDINLAIEKGEFVAIVGYSGAGKTTLMSMIAGLIQPDTGTITLNDLEITEPGPDRGVVFQNYSLLPWLTVYENIYLAVDQVFPNWSPDKKDSTPEIHRHGEPDPGPRQKAERILRRHAPAGVRGARAGHGPADPAAG